MKRKEVEIPQGVVVALHPEAAARHRASNPYRSYSYYNGDGGVAEFVTSLLKMKPLSAVVGRKKTVIVTLIGTEAESFIDPYGNTGRRVEVLIRLLEGLLPDDAIKYSSFYGVIISIRVNGDSLPEAHHTQQSAGYAEPHVAPVSSAAVSA